jgi:hypothetical protein
LDHSTICDVAILGDGPTALVVAAAAALAGADTFLLGAEDAGEDILLAAILAEQVRQTGVRRLAHCVIRRVVRHGRSLTAIVGNHEQIQARVFVDASKGLHLLSGAGAATGAPPSVEPMPGREFLDTIAVCDTPDGRCALPLSAALIPTLDNALAVPSGDGLPPALAIAGAHAIGVAAALLAASGQPAGAFDSATLRERLRSDGAQL